MENKDIYKMEVHEEIALPTKYVMRVPGGWLYTDRRGESAVGTFVPYSTEFLTDVDF